ncbi:DNA translocase FtsK [Bacillus infantis]|uniref:DNA translocase FtsK n=1 Tax=Bacillus infantis TaxID=324767 RepID=UPI002155EE06|nr:DNA translocase FtsK [Bacillus infantis]MCR6612339.1 DNA translocase FtsK [Bacillus infantis]
MSWIKKLFRVFNNEDEYKEMEEEQPYIEPAKPKKNRDGREMEARILYQYPKGQFRFPLIPDEGSPGKERRSGEKPESPGQDPQRRQRERPAAGNRNHERGKAGPLNDNPNQGKRNKRQPEQQEPYSEPSKKSKSDAPIDNRHRRPFRPTEIPSPIYGFERPKKKEESVVYEMNSFGQEKNAPFFDDIDFLKKTVLDGSREEESKIVDNTVEPVPEEQPEGIFDLKGTISPDLRVGYEEASAVPGRAEESPDMIIDKDIYMGGLSNPAAEKAFSAEVQEDEHIVTTKAGQENVMPESRDSYAVLTADRIEADSSFETPALAGVDTGIASSNPEVMDSSTPAAGYNTAPASNLDFEADEAPDENAGGLPAVNRRDTTLLEDAELNRTESEEFHTDIPYNPAGTEPAPLNLAAVPESADDPEESLDEAEIVEGTEDLKELSAEGAELSQGHDEKNAELHVGSVKGEHETGLHEAASALLLDEAVPETEEGSAGETRGDVPARAEEEPKPKPRSPLPFNVIMLKQDRRIAEQKKEQTAGAKQMPVTRENTEEAAPVSGEAIGNEAPENTNAQGCQEDNVRASDYKYAPQPNETAIAAEPARSQQQAEEPAEQSQAWSHQKPDGFHLDGQPAETALLEQTGEPKYKAYEFPAKSLLAPPVIPENNEEWLLEQEEFLNLTLKNFNVRAKVVNVTQGPSVTRFEVQPEPGVKVNKITNLTDDIKLSLAARDIRMEAPIPGKHTIGIEVPNQKSRPVLISEIINTPVFRDGESPLTAVLGLDISGSPIVTDLRKMPHGLIAGATGSGKSVCINSILVSLLYKASPDELKLLLIDPKMVELAPYNQIPHLVSPVITDVKAATAALKWAVEEMERRYELFAHAGVRDINRFNQLAKQHKRYSDKLPFIVIVIDELADLMMMSPADVEEAICRIAQKARACGIHLIIATQRPSVDVITGLIKANVPTRVAFSVSSQVDSRTIIDISGAEKLLGRGDMLFLENGSSKPVRLQGTYVSDAEIDEVVAHARSQRKPDYLFEQEELLKKAQATEEEDELFYEACEYVVDQGSASTSSVQRRFKIGYNRAARLIGMMEDCGYISEAKGSKPRDVLITETDLEAMQDTSTML